MSTKSLKDLFSFKILFFPKIGYQNKKKILTDRILTQKGTVELVIEEMAFEKPWLVRSTYF